MANINSGTPAEVAYILYSDLEAIEFKENLGQKPQNAEEALELYKRCLNATSGQK